MDITKRISKGLFRQYRGMRLLLELLQEEYSQMQEAENSEELAKHELAIQELIRQLLKEREEMHFYISSLSSPESGISDIMHMFPEENREKLRSILEEMNILESSCNKQAEVNADMAMALVEQSNNLLEYFNKQLWPREGDVYSRKATWHYFNENASILEGKF